MIDGQKGGQVDKYVTQREFFSGSGLQSPRLLLPTETPNNTKPAGVQTFSNFNLETSVHLPYEFECFEEE